MAPPWIEQDFQNCRNFGLFEIYERKTENPGSNPYLYGQSSTHTRSFSHTPSKNKDKLITSVFPVTSTAVKNNQTGPSVPSIATHSTSFVLAPFYVQIHKENLSKFRKSEYV